MLIYRYLNNQIDINLSKLNKPFTCIDEQIYFFNPAPFSSKTASLMDLI